MIGRIPIWVSRRCIHGGDGRVGSMPRTIRATNRSQPACPSIGAASASRTAYPSSVGSGTESSAGSRKPPSVDPCECQYSRARPRIEKQ